MKYPIFLTLLLIFAKPALAQQPFVHVETADDPYVQVDRSLMERRPAYRSFSPDFYTTQVNVDAQGMDIVGDAANEPSIAIDPTNPDRIVIGWRQFDTTSSNFRQAGYGFSLDGGLSFTFPGVLDPGVFRSDPVLDFDQQGNFYYNSLRDTFECDVFSISDGGVNWGAPVPAFGGDKQWMHVDRDLNSGSQHIYAYWNRSFTTCIEGAFTRSTDQSGSFEDCLPVPEDPFWGTMTTNSEGDLFVVGRTGSELLVSRSVTAKDPSLPVTWDQTTAVDLDGLPEGGGAVNPSGLLGQTWIDADRSGGPLDGTIYVLSTVARNNGDPADVMFARSQDQGQTWSPPQRINLDDQFGSYQWFGTLSVAPNGRIDVVFLDSSGAPPGTVDSRLIYTWSADGGDSWSEYTVISDYFDPTIGYPNQNKMGDYFDMKSDNDFAHLSWCNTLNGGQDVYYSRISPEGLLSNDNFSQADAGWTAYPNPFEKVVHLSLKGYAGQSGAIRIYDIAGRHIRTLFKGTISDRATLRWDGTNHSGERVGRGLYFVQLKTSNSSAGMKLLKL